MLKTSHLWFGFALSLQFACDSDAPPRDGGRDDAAPVDADTDRAAEEGGRDAAADSSDLWTDASDWVSDAEAERDGASGDGLAPVQIVASGRSRVSVANRVICALDERRDVVCWGSDRSSERFSGVALRGPFRSVLRCGVNASGSVCALAEDGALTCAGPDGGPSDFLYDPQECPQPVAAAAFSCGNFSVSALAVLDPDGALFRLADSCDLSPEGPTTGVYARVEMVHDNICAIDDAQKIHCFASTQLPDGGLSPERPAIEDAYVDLALKENVTCGVTREGRVRCWDYLGVENMDQDGFAASASSRGVKVMRLASDPEGGNILCALFEDGSVGCSLSFERGAIGMLQTDMPWIEIAVDRETVCGVRSDRSVVCRPSRSPCTDPNCATLAELIASPEGLRVPE